MFHWDQEADRRRPWYWTVQFTCGHWAFNSGQLCSWLGGNKKPKLNGKRKPLFI